MDPSYPYNFPPPPPLPSSADLFDPQETTDLFGFLDQFGGNNSNNNSIWDSYDSYMLPPRSAPPSFPHHLIHPQQHPPPPHSASPSTSSRRPSPPPSSTTPRAKPLLSTPQKRLNHIMSEQKRRNAIRDGYAQLIALLGDPAAAMPTRGRPKGRGGANKTAGKSGVLFRAVEYVRFLEEGRDALKREVERLEARNA